WPLRGLVVHGRRRSSGPLAGPAGGRVVGLLDLLVVLLDHLLLAGPGIDLDLLVDDVLLDDHELDAAGLLAALPGVVVRDRPVRAKADGFELAGRDAVIAQVLHHRAGARGGQRLVVAPAPFRAGMALDADPLDLRVLGDHRADLVHQIARRRPDRRPVVVELDLLVDLDLVISDLDAWRRGRDGRGVPRHHQRALALEFDRAATPRQSGGGNDQPSLHQSLRWMHFHPQTPP